MNKRVMVGVVVLALAAAGAARWHFGRQQAANELLLRGNVDLRQVDLPFKDNERIVEVLAQEGDRVRSGQVLARLDVGRLHPRIARAEAQVAAQTEALRRLKNGSRPEEIAQARANWDSARADAENAQSQYERLAGISHVSGSRAVSQLDLDAARANLRVAQARLENVRKALQLTIAGPREEDVAQGKAQLDEANAELALLLRQLADAELVAPTAAVVRSRLLEPGEMATPQRPVFSLALTDPKWVRVYVSESDLGRLKPGMAANIRIDGFPDQPLEGWVGFISSMSEFTPKSVQTEELRTNLVYEVRVFVKDPQDVLRLGMPATVHLDLRRAELAQQPKVASVSDSAIAAGGSHAGRE
jgi:HlyD family secretion protein